MTDMRIFDKAQWHIDAGEPKAEVVAKIKTVFRFLSEHGLLTDEGKEVFNTGIDSSVSLHERLVNEEGAQFLEAHYDALLPLPSAEIEMKLTKLRQIGTAQRAS
jgi:hypothetical protein